MTCKMSCSPDGRVGVGKTEMRLLEARNFSIQLMVFDLQIPLEFVDDALGTCSINSIQTLASRELLVGCDILVSRGAVHVEKGSFSGACR